MKEKYPLFSEVVLAEDMPAYNLKRGDSAIIVEHYSMPGENEDGYSLEGLQVPQVTIEVSASQIISASQWQREEAILLKVRQLPETERCQLETYLDALMQKNRAQGNSTRISA